MTTARHMFQKPVTQQYPEQEPDLPPNYRGVHRLNRDEQGRVKCVACYMCATACPAHCIDIVAAPSPWPDREKYPETFVIDELRCIYCGMCEEACPVDAIELTSLYDLTGLSREEMMFDKEKLLSVFDQTVNGTGSVITRWNLDMLATLTPGSTPSGQYFSDLAGSVTLTPVTGATTTMYFAKRETLASLAVFAWPEDEPSPSGPISVAHALAPDNEPYQCPSLDGTNWCGRIDGRLHTGWLANGVIGFAFGASQGSGGLGSF
ncbi:MAG: NADH-quinone oxidoreductase subunit I, partial [Alicyclobacillus sp.]|nr:NADH-quinone oxidoreductase subunit I [Alicyclobacillus sp.]